MMFSLLRPSLTALVLLSIFAIVQNALPVNARVFYVLEPFELSAEDEAAALADAGRTEDFDYESGNVTFVGSGATASTDSAFGNGALRVWLQDNDDGEKVKQLTWIIGEEEAAFNCLGATYMSLWVKTPKEILLTLFLLDDSRCTNNCSEASNLVKYSTEAVSLGGEQWQEVKADLPMQGVRLDHLRGWGFYLEAATPDNSDAGHVVLIDHLACVGGGELLGAAFHFNSKDSDAFDQAIESRVWQDEYYLSPLSENLTNTQLAGGMMTMDPYTIEQAESWGGFFSYKHIAPGNAYYNLSEASAVTMDYHIMEPSSNPGRAHFRLMLLDGADCTSECKDPKNLEAYYSFHYVLDEIKSDSFSVDLKGDGDISSPFWLPGWIGSVHDRVFDPASVKGIIVELNVDSQGNITSLIEGSAAFGRLAATSGTPPELPIPETTLTEDKSIVSYVMEPFELSMEASMVAFNGTTKEYSYVAGNVSFVGNGVSASTDSAFGGGALRVQLLKGEMRQLSWVLPETDPSFNCWGATYLSLWIKAQTNAELTVSLMDDSACESNCTDRDNLQSYSSNSFNLQVGDWQELRMVLPLGGVKLDHIRGWGINLKGEDTDSDSAVLVDHLACVGGEDLLGAAFHFDSKGSNSFEKAVRSNVWQDEYYLSELSRNLTHTRLEDGMLALDPYAIEQTESWGGFFSYKHIAPGNAYYNLSKASEVTMDYEVTETCSTPGRAHLRLMLLEGADCTSECTDPKNLEAYYSFHYVLDEVKSDSISVLLEGNDDSSSPLWLTGWIGSAHDKVFDPAVVKGFVIEMNVDSQGNVTSLVEGSVSVGRLQASSPLESEFVEDDNVQVSYVLESFELPAEAGDISSSVERAFTIIEEHNYSPGNLTLLGSDALAVTASADAAFGSGALRVWLEPSFGKEQLTWILKEDDAAFNCWGATHLSLWYKTKTPDIILTLFLLDDSKCSSNCTEMSNLLSFSSEAILLARDKWQELKLELPLGGVRLDHVRGWGFALESTGNGTGSAVLFDHLACVGRGDLVGAAFDFDSGRSDAFEKAVESNLWSEEYYSSELSRNLTHTQLEDGMFAMEPYTIEQTESWGGFFSYKHVAPGNSYYNLSQASELIMDYEVSEVSSAPGRAHMRLILYDAANCTSQCNDPKNLEVFYSFHYILDELDSASLSVVLQGDDIPSSPLWLPGWVGSAHDKVFDPAVVKGFVIEMNVDSQGDISSLVDGSVSVGRLRASYGQGKAEEHEGDSMAPNSLAVVEASLLLGTDGGTFTRVEFRDLAACIELCTGDPACLYGFSSDRDCYMAEYLEPASVDLPTTAFEKSTYNSFWMDDAVRRGDFCDLCDCQESNALIDCNGQDLAILPKTFMADWSPRLLDLSGNPRLLVLGSESLIALTKTLEEVILPEDALYIAPTAFPQGISVSSPSAGLDSGLKNAIVGSTGFYSDICCGRGEQAAGLTFCDMQVDHPGSDSIFLPFTQFIHADVVERLTPGSEFGSEAAQSPEKCAEYCRLFPECRYFSYDARYREAEHTCWLLDDNGTRADYLCCEEVDYADLAMTLPGWTSGVAPRTRNEIHNAVVVVSPVLLKAEKSNNYRVQFGISLGSMPLRGAVWVEPTLASATKLNYSLSPSRVALYDNATTTTVTLEILNPEVVAGIGETLIISNHLQSCDRAFVALDTEAENVFVSVAVPQEENLVFLLLGISLTILAAVLALAVYVVVDRRRLAKMAAQNALDETERDEVMEVQRLTSADNLRIDIGRCAMLSLLVVAGVSMTVWANHELKGDDDTPASIEVQNPEAEDKDDSDSASTYVYVLPVVFVLLLVAFAVYDWFVRIRNRKLVLNAAMSGEIMVAMFPRGIREKLLNETRTNRNATKDNKRRDETEESEEALADLYPSTTVCFMDICGFTAWSSTREPYQVFQLLEQVFGRFDKLAKRHEVYKVETIGDCYVCIAGAPVEHEDHAVKMCRFVSCCLKQFSSLSKDLVVSLGPDTSELQLRAGMHSGQVTMGVLRNDRARYQLFGDCVNTTARMESTGKAGRVQVSLETAELLREAGRGAWVVPREDKVLAKGKGQLKTFWLDTRAARRDEHAEDTSSKISMDDRDSSFFHISGELSRLIDWNTEQLLAIIKKIVAYRKEAPKGRVTARASETFTLKQDQTYLDEVAEIIHLPKSTGQDFDTINVRDVHIDAVVIQELRLLVKSIASLYNDNPFHNFEHASHVVLSILKLLSRIVKPSQRQRSSQLTLDDYSYGITSDPLTHFAVAFCGLVHDADHPGVPNNQMIKEDPILGARFEERSVAEQNSLKQAFDLITNDDYHNLRYVLFRSNEDQDRFRQLVVNSVMATDIGDKELKALRNARWDKAFNGFEEDEEKDRNRKATIVIEHLIQASDVSHTMQHWNVYRKWNEKLLQELYQAYKAGRSQTDPTLNWAKGEIGFFDFYIIPLAKKLKECGVFGVSSDEYLNYAIINRRMWEEQGTEITAEMVVRLQETDLPSPQEVAKVPIAPPRMSIIDEDHSANSEGSESLGSASVSGHIANEYLDH